MIQRWWCLLIAMGSLVVARAELAVVEVTPLKDKPGATSEAGVFVHLIDGHAKDGLIAGLLTVPDSFGEIEACALVLREPDGSYAGRIVMGAMVLEKGARDFEFHLRRSLLEKSYIMVSHRGGEDLRVLKIELGVFPVRTGEEVMGRK